MNLLLHLTLRGALAFAVVTLLEWTFASRITAKTRRLWWLLVPLSFLVLVPASILPHPLSNSLPRVSSLDRMDAWAGPLVLPSPPTAFSPGLPQLFLLCTLLGGTVIYLSVVMVRTHAAMYRWRRGRLSTDSALLALLENCKARAGITAPIGLVVTEDVASPVLLGWLRPRVLLPTGLSATLPREQLRGVLFHELAHFRSLDVPANWLFTAVCALHWFNPAAHLALRAWTTFREEAADEAAIVWLGQSSEIVYGETLLRVLRTTHGQPAPYAALAIVESVNQLRKRILMIKHHEQKKPRLLLTGILLAAALGLILRPVQAVEPGTEDPKAVASGVMMTWLQEIDGGKYEQSWNAAAPSFQKAITAQKWTAALDGARKPLGSCTARKLASAVHQTSVPSPAGIHQGDFILAQFEASFDNLKYSLETVTFEKTADGTWKASGYYVKPKL